jgi:enoyl-CoA hydratase/carnithine racemase
VSSGDGDLAIVVLDQPPLNLIDETVFDGLRQAVASFVDQRPRRVVSSTAPEAVLVEVRGGVVFGGVDVHVFQEITEGRDAVGRGNALWARLIRLAPGAGRSAGPTIFAAPRVHPDRGLRAGIGLRRVSAAWPGDSCHGQPHVEPAVELMQGLGGRQFPDRFGWRSNELVLRQPDFVRVVGDPGSAAHVVRRR